MAFLSLSDEDGVFEVTFFPNIWRRFKLMLNEHGMGPYVVDGIVEDQYDAITVTANRVQTLGECLEHIRPEVARQPIPHRPGAGNGFGKRTANHNASAVEKVIERER